MPHAHTNTYRHADRYSYCDHEPRRAQTRPHQLRWRCTPGRIRRGHQCWRLSAQCPELERAGRDGNIFYFPSHIMQPEQVCRVYTDEYHPEHCGFSFENDRAIWGDSGDIVILKDPSGTTVDDYCWGSGCT